MPKIDIARLAVDSRTGYPPPFDRVVGGRERKRLGHAAGLDQFGVNLTTLKPGASSSLRHWHEKEDELIYILEGEVVLVEDGGETVLRGGTRRPSRPTAVTGIISSTGRRIVRSILKSARARSMSVSNIPTSI
jgi:uncharacterized cupin superfamily protein